MAVLSWDDENAKYFCARCLWRDERVDICNCVDPPIVKPFLPTKPSDCHFIPEERWRQRPKEYQERELAAKKERSRLRMEDLRLRKVGSKD